MRPGEFAETYSRGERHRLVVVGVVLGLVVVSAGKFLVFPWLAQFSASAHCRSVLGFAGPIILSYGLFVGLPLLLAVFVGLVAGHRGLLVLRDNQFPPLGEKAFRRIPIRRGAVARRIGYLN